MLILHHRKAADALPAASWGPLAGLAPLYIASLARLYNKPVGVLSQGGFPPRQKGGIHERHEDDACQRPPVFEGLVISFHTIIILVKVSPVNIFF